MAKTQLLGECWVWTGARDGDKRYGVVRVDGNTRLVHRVAYEEWVEPIPDGLVIDHVAMRGCISILCINPAHLEPVTQQENTLRSAIAPGAVNSRKTHCPQQHEYTTANTYIDKRGKRYCRACQRDRMRRRYHAERV